MTPHKKEGTEIRDIHEVSELDLSLIKNEIYKILSEIYIGPYKHMNLLNYEETKREGKKLINAGIPLQYYENPSILIENGIDRDSKIFYYDGVPAGIVAYKLELQKEEKYMKLFKNNNINIENGYIELKSFFVFSDKQKKGIGTEMFNGMFDFFRYNLGRGDGILVTVNKKKLEYVYSFFLKNGFIDIGSDINEKLDLEGEQSEHVLYYSTTKNKS